VFTPLHKDCRVTPEGNVTETVQLVIELLPAVTVTPPWKPPGQLPVSAYVAVQPAAAAALTTPGAAPADGARRATANPALASAAPATTHVLRPGPDRLRPVRGRPTSSDMCMPFLLGCRGTAIAM